MKKLFLSLIFSLYALASNANKIEPDSIPNYNYGWMVFVNQEVIWVPAFINEKTTTDDFFLHSEYTGGLIVTTYNEASEYKKIAKSYSVEFGSKKIPYTISIIPVKAVKYKSSETEGSDTLVYLFIKNNQEIFVKYQFAATYYTGEISLIRKCDKRKYKKNKRKSLRTG